MQKSNPKRKLFKAQTQAQPGIEYRMDPPPIYHTGKSGSNRMYNKRCIITGGDSGIGRAVAIAFASEGADVALIYLSREQEDAEFTADFIQKAYKRRCLLVPTDIAKENNCKRAIATIQKEFRGIDVLVNNAAVQFPENDFLKLKTKNLIETFSVNIFGMFWLTRAALKHMKGGSSIINTTSVTAYRGSAGLVDYSATKGAICSFTRSLSSQLVEKAIRVNGVAPGPVWTPLIPGSFPAMKVATFGSDVPMKRPGQPVEIAHAYVFLASDDSTYMTGQVLHVNGGEIVNG